MLERTVVVVNPEGLHARPAARLVQAAGQFTSQNELVANGKTASAKSIVGVLRLGVSLPALMQLLGHKDIRMTLRYLQVTQQDLQREFHLARQAAAHPHRIPKLPLIDPFSAPPDLAGIQGALRATRHLLEMYRRQLSDEKTRRKLQRLDHRLLGVASQVKQLATAEK